MEFKKFMEALKGNQHKLDANKNGKLDAHDFKLLRKENDESEYEDEDEDEVENNEKEMDEAADRVARADYKVNPSGRKAHREITFKDGSPEEDEDKKVKEEYELDEATYSIKNTKTGQIYFHSKYPITKDNSRLKKIQAAGGDHIHATPHKDGKPLSEASMTDAEMKKREEIVKGMKKNVAGFKSKYGARAKDVMYATATKLAMKEESELDEAFINGREYASHGLMHPDHAKMNIHQKTGNTIDFYASKSGDKISGKVVKNDGKEVHISATNGNVHKFKVTPNLPKQNNEELEMTEQAPVAPSLVKHRIGVTVSEPDHPMVSKRKEKVQKFVVVTHSDNKEGAQKVGEKFYKKKGFVVHDSHHAGMVNEETLDELSVNKMLTYRSKATEKLGSDASKDAKRKEGIRVSGEKIKDKNSMKKEQKDLPFDAPYKKVEDEKTKDKSGAVHSPMSRARHLARQAMKKQMKEAFNIDITDDQADSLVEAANTEQLDEISKATLGSYVKKAKTSAIGASQVAGMGSNIVGQKTAEKAEKKVQKRAQGINKAVDRLTREDVDFDEEGNLVAEKLSFTDFLAKINEQLLEYEAKSGVYRHKGSYGSAYQGSDDEDDEDDKPKKAAPDAPKRGRGRPAGSTGASYKPRSAETKAAAAAKAAASKAANKK